MPLLPGRYVATQTRHKETNPLIAFLIHIPIIGLLCQRLYGSNQGQALLPLFWWALAAKLLAGIAIGLLYTYYYPYSGDTFAYFGDASQLATFAHQSLGTYLKILFYNDSGAEAFLSTLSSWYQPRAFFMVKLVSILCLLTLNNYWLCSLYLSLLCFYKLWKLASTLAAFFPSSAGAAGIAFLLLPSVVFWSTGLTKESLAIACIAGIIRLFLQWWHRRYLTLHPAQDYSKSIGMPANAALATTYQTANTGLTFSFSGIISWLLLPVYVWLLLQLKYYYLAALLPTLLAFIVADTLMHKFFVRQRLAVGLFILITVFASILLAATFLHPNLHIANFLEALVTNHNITLQASAPENIIDFTDLQPQPGNVIMQLPKAIFSGIFRPLVWEGNSIFHKLVGIENLLLLLISLYVLFTRRSIFSQLQPSFALLIMSALLYILLLSALLALSSPNFGALSRYKVAFMPFFAYLLLWAAKPGPLPNDKGQKMNR
jgi:hypothetical protein